ncbi:retrovirus-related pol polyprotein from transposon TNT 1-94, partial [Tanacetum coccineum]
ELQYFEQTPIVGYPDNEITSDSNIILYSQYLEETQQAIVQNTNTSTQQNSMILSIFEQMSNHATNWDNANNESKIVNKSLTAELERYKEQVKILKQRFNVDLSGHEKFIDSQMDDMIRMKNTKFAALETNIDTLKHSKHVKENESLLTTLNCFKTKFKERESKSIDKDIVLELYQSMQAMHMLTKPQPILYDGNVLSKTHDVLYVVDDEETLILAKESRLKMVEKQNDPIMKKEKINITPINYFELNKIAEDFGKCFVPQPELFAEQMFWLQSSNKNFEEPSTSNTPVKIEVPSELPKFDKGLHDELTKVQTVFTQMKAAVEQFSMQLNQEFFQKDKSCVNQNALEIQEYFKQNDLQGQLHTKDTIINKLKETIYSLRDNANPAKVKRDIDEIEMINIELEHSVAKLLSENEKLHKEKEHLKKTYKELYDSIKPTRVRAKEQCDALIVNLNSKELKGKDMISTAVSKPNATTIAPGMYKLELEPLPPKVLQNKDAHMNYIKHSREHADILRDIVESARALSPLDSNLDSACKYVQRIQEVLVYVKDKFPCLKKLSEKLVAVTPKNKDKKVRFADLVTPSSNTQKQVDSHKTKDSNQPLLYSTGVICSTGASGSKSTGNKKTNRISQSSSNNKNNKVEDQSRSVKSRINKKNRVAKIKCNAYVMQSVLNANSKSVCAICNECLFDAIMINVVQIVLWHLDSGCSKRMTGNRSQLTNFVNKFLGTVKFGNDQIVKIMGYGDYQIGNVTISRVYYVEGLGHYLFFVGQFCDSDLEVAFRKHTCFVCNLKGVDLLTGSRGNNLYTLSIGDMMKSSSICLLSKASKTKSWLWHRCLSYLNFGTINQLAKQGLVRGLPKLKLEKDHLPMRVESINRKKYILVIVDDYSWFTWVKFLRLKDEAPKFIIKFLKMIQVRLNATVRNIRTDNDSVATACYTQNRSLIRLHHGKTPYELLNDRKPNISYLHVFGALCYLTNDSEDLSKLKAKADVDFDELIAMASKQSSLGPAVHEMTHGTLSSGLVPQPPSSTTNVPPKRNDWDTLLQSLFDDYFRPAPCVNHPVPEVADLVLAISTGSPSSTSIDQDTPSPSTSQTPRESPSHVILLGAKEADHDIEIAHMDNHPYVGILIPSPSSKESSS